MNAQQLKNSILQEAIEGRLVPQDPNDEPASVLLKRICKEKERLVKVGKLKKKDLEVKPISDDEIPFEIPDSWVWVRLVDVGIAETGTTPSKSHPEYFGTFIPFLGPANMLNGQIISETQGLSEIGAIYGRIVPEGSILQVCIGGSIGKCAIVDKPVTFNQQINSITPLVCVIGFIFYVLQSDYFRLAIKEKSTGTATPIINRGNWEQIAIPLPPLAEQQRIVLKIEELLPKVEEYGKAQDALNKLNTELPERLKKSILQEAISGRLVPQDPNDEPASDLLDKIRKEKAQLVKEGKLKKKDLVETPISEDEKPFEIPESWKWARLNDICTFLSRGKSPSYSDVPNNYPVFAQKCNLKDGGISLEQARFLKVETVSKWQEVYHLRTDDVLVNSTGTGTVCRTRLFHERYLGNYPFTVPDSHVSVVRTSDNICSAYIYHLFNSKIYQDYWEDRLAGSTNQKELYIGVLQNTIIPLPPLAEQKRIVAKIEELFGKIEQMKK